MSVQSKDKMSCEKANKIDEKVSQKNETVTKKTRKPVYQKTFINEYQLEWSFLIILIVTMLYFIPQTSQFIKPALIVEGKLGPDFYDHSGNDYYYVCFAVVLLIFIRSFFLNIIFKNIAVHLIKFKKQGAINRFCEQSWFFVQYGTCFLCDFSMLYKSDYYNNLDYLFKDYPHKLTLASKYYYLTVIAIWIFHIFVIHVEKRRKDHYEMLSHHIITVLLVYGSYKYYFTRIGNLILVIMNFVDIWLALAKVLRYCGFSNLCDFTFLIFFFSWIVLRHGLFNYVIYFSYTKVHVLLSNVLCSEAVNDKNCLSENVVYSLIALLAGLQCIMCFWMYMILKVLYKILSGANAEDVRSDSESEESADYDGEEKYEKALDKKEQDEKKNQEK